jgi:muramoyltetrapeptide carboxypeptidase LdcA involved in peptidoglycan recycling
MRYPKFIKPGDSIMFVAPSFGATTYPYSTRVKWAKKFFEQQGIEIKSFKTFEEYEEHTIHS